MTDIHKKLKTKLMELDMILDSFEPTEKTEQLSSLAMAVYIDLKQLKVKQETEK